MSKAFGTEFVIVNDIVQLLDPEVFGGGPWLHLATVRRGMREYMAFKHVDNAHDPQRNPHGAPVYIEIVDPHTIALNKIEDDAEWYDVAKFLQDAKLLEMGIRKEMKLDTALVFQD